MAVLIQSAWSTQGAVPSDSRIVTAILPSGKILTPDDDDGPTGTPRADLQRFIGIWKLRGKSEAEIFHVIDLEFGSMFGTFRKIDDPNMAREIIKKAGLTATITPRERLDYRRDFDGSVGDGTQISRAEIRIKKSLEQSNGNRKEKA